MMLIFKVVGSVVLLYTLEPRTFGAIGNVREKMNPLIEKRAGRVGNNSRKRQSCCGGDPKPCKCMKRNERQNYTTRNKDTLENPWVSMMIAMYIRHGGVDLIAKYCTWFCMKDA